MCVNNLPKVVSWKWNGRESNPRPFVSRANTVPNHYTTRPDAVAPKNLVSPVIQTDQQHCMGFCYRDRVYHTAYHIRRGWLGSRVVRRRRSGFKSQPRNSPGETLHTHRASVHQAAKLVAALFLGVVGVTVLAESNGSLPPSL